MELGAHLTATTLRPMRVKVLDQGYVEIVPQGCWGSDELIVESARMSTQKGFQGWGAAEAPGDEKLLKFLWENRHSTPFEFAGATFEIRAPICVFREWHRHRTQSYTEASARYAPLPAIDYMPTIDRLLRKNGANKQANAVKGAEELTQEAAQDWLWELQAHYERSEDVYKAGLKAGVPKELARLALTVGRYSTMRASTDLRNWLGFEVLRSDHHPDGEAAQEEIRLYANAVGDFLAKLFPRTWELFTAAKRAAEARA